MTTPAFWPAVGFGGPVVKVATLAREIRRLGFGVEIWATDFSQRPPGARSIARGPYSVVVDGVRVTYFPKWLAYRWFPLIVSGLRASLVAGHFEVVHCFGVRDAFSTAVVRASRAADVPVLIEPLGMLKPAVRKTRIKHLMDRAWTVRSCASASRIIVNSRFEFAEVSQILPQGNVVLRRNPGTAALARLSDVSSTVDLDVVSVGRLARKKNLPMLIDAVLAAKARLTIVGPDDGDGTRQLLQRRIDGEGLQELVRLAGPLWEADLHSVLRSADVFVLASETENFGQAAVDAAAAGLPLVVSENCGVAEVVREVNCGLVVAPTAPAISSALRRLRDPQLRSELRQNCPKMLRALDPALIAADQALMYADVIEEHTAAVPSRS